VPVSRVAAAVAVPASGARASLTGSTGVDILLTSVAVLAVIAGLSRLDREDVTVLVIGAVSGSGLLFAAYRSGDVSAAVVAAAVVGASLGLITYAWPPSTLRTGRSASTVIGAALSAVAVDLHPLVSSPSSMLVPLVFLGVCVAPLIVSRLDRRLEARRLPPHLALGLAALVAAVAGDALARDAMPAALAVAIAAAPTLVLMMVALTTSSRSRRATPRRWPRFAVSAALFAATVIAAIAGLQLIEARSTMERGRAAAEVGLAAAADGDLRAAEAAFAQATTEFSSAERRLSHPAVSVGVLVPGIAQNLRAARTLADVGKDLSGTASTVASRAGADELRVVDGRFPIEASRRVGGDLHNALAQLDIATDRLHERSSPLLLSEVADANDAIAARVERSRGTIEIAAEATRLAPKLLGGDEPGRWFLGVLASSELRGTGGILGDYAELRTEDGKISLAKNGSVAELNAASDPESRRGILPPIYAAAGSRSGSGRTSPSPPTCRRWQRRSATATRSPVATTSTV
jgi:UDP-N-acetylmuramyl pentapeptide phosphotransferase/UDP-N-acetylglucosamine-1-phosphate transferase